MHFILRHLKKSMCDDDIQVIATNSEQFISVQFKGLRFIDSCQFLNASLEKLVANLRESTSSGTPSAISAGTNFIWRREFFHMNIWTPQTGSWRRDSRAKEQFYSRLTEEDITDGEYVHAQEVFRKMDFRNLKDYHDYYLKLDVLLLADVFEEFRTLAIRIYGLDPAHFYTLPGLSWDACLKKTSVNLDLLTDEAMYLFFENNIRGGKFYFIFFYLHTTNIFFTTNNLFVLCLFLMQTLMRKVVFLFVVVQG